MEMRDVEYLEMEREARALPTAAPAAPAGLAWLDEWRSAWQAWQAGCSGSSQKILMDEEIQTLRTLSACLHEADIRLMEVP